MAENSLPIGNLADILAIEDVSHDVVEVPEWNCSVKIKALSKGDQIRIRKQSVQGNRVDDEKMEGLLFVYGVVEPKFSPEHITRLFEKSSGPVDRILQRIMKISGMTEEDAADAADTFQS